MLSTVLHNYDLRIITFYYFDYLCCGEWWKILAAARIENMLANFYKLIKGLTSLVDLFKVFGGLIHLTPLFNCTPFLHGGDSGVLDFILFGIFLHVISKHFPIICYLMVANMSHL